MTTNNNDKAFTNAARQAFDASVESLDGDTVSAIVRARRRALDKSAFASRRGFWIMLPAAGALATVVLATVLYFSWSSGSGNGLEAEDLDMLSSSESLEFYEDLEFYQWLDESDQAS